MRTSLLALSLVFVQCTSHEAALEEETSETGNENPEESSDENNPAYHERLQQIAGEYLDYGRADDEARWAPFLCRIPQPPVARLSTSDDEGTHGRKLYSVLAKDASSYRGLEYEKKPIPEGLQVLVKESWHPVEASDEVQAKVLEEGGSPLGPFWGVETEASTVANRFIPNSPDSWRPFALRDGKIYTIGEKGPLFIMFQEQNAGPNNDEGWIYGTIAEDGTVTGAGQMRSCMRCHRDAPHGRLFGLQPAPWQYQQVKSVLEAQISEGKK